MWLLNSRSWMFLYFFQDKDRTISMAHRLPVVTLSLALILSTFPEPWAWDAHTVYPDFHNFLVFLANKTQYLHPNPPLPAALSAYLSAVGLIIVYLFPSPPPVGFVPQGQRLNISPMPFTKVAICREVERDGKGKCEISRSCLCPRHGPLSRPPSPGRLKLAELP